MLKQTFLTAAFGCAMIAFPLSALGTENQTAAVSTDTDQVIKLDTELSPKAGSQVFVIEQKLPEFLRQAARRNNMRATISKRVRGVLRKVNLPLDIREIMPQIEEQFDLVWHIQQNQLFVSLGSENASRLIFLDGMDMNDLSMAMDDVGMRAAAFDLSYVEDSNSVMVNGPVSYVAGIELIVQSYNKNRSLKRNKVRVIRYGSVGK